MMGKEGNLVDIEHEEENISVEVSKGENFEDLDNNNSLLSSSNILFKDEA